MKVSTLSLFIAALTTGVMSGIFFTWTNAVTTGIGRLTDMQYLSALQSMNRTILNPWFYLFFFSAFITPILAVIFNLKSTANILMILILAALIYFGGVFLVTVFGNIPLNQRLESHELNVLSDLELSNLRNAIEQKWNMFNAIRTASALITFGLLLFVIFRIGQK